MMGFIIGASIPFFFAFSFRLIKIKIDSNKAWKRGYRAAMGDFNLVKSKIQTPEFKAIVKAEALEIQDGNFLAQFYITVFTSREAMK